VLSLCDLGLHSRKWWQSRARSFRGLIRLSCLRKEASVMPAVMVIEECFKFHQNLRLALLNWKEVCGQAAHQEIELLSHPKWYYHTKEDTWLRYLKDSILDTKLSLRSSSLDTKHLLRVGRLNRGWMGWYKEFFGIFKKEGLGLTREYNFWFLFGLASSGKLV